jgi:hypothetical protein
LPSFILSDEERILPDAHPSCGVLLDWLISGKPGLPYMDAILKQQIPQLTNVITATHSFLPKNVAVITKFLNDYGVGILKLMHSATNHHPLILPSTGISSG